MPTLPVYIRVDDLDKWKSLPNKSEFIHNALNDSPFIQEVSTEAEAKELTRRSAGTIKPIKTKEDAEKAISYKKTSNWGA